MLWSLLISGLIVAIGGAMYLFQNGFQMMHLTQFQQQPKSLDSVFNIISDFKFNNSKSVIQLGVLVLVFAQGARVLFTGLIFLKQKDYLFVSFSVFILLVLIATCIWKF